MTRLESQTAAIQTVMPTPSQPGETDASDGWEHSARGPYDRAGQL